MPETLQNLITACRSQLDESAARFWTDTELTIWINDCLRDIARRAEVLQSFNQTISIVAGTNKYALPTDVVRLHRVEFVPTGSSQVYPVVLKTYQEMDQVWGINPANQSAYPSYAVMWGTPGLPSGVSQLQIQLFPVPSQGGTLNVYYYKLPYQFLDPIANPGELSKNAEIPEGWWDLVTIYVEYRGRRKDHDPFWKEARAEYEDMMLHLVEATREWHDQSKSIITPTTSVPSWLYEFSE